MEPEADGTNLTENPPTSPGRDTAVAALVPQLRKFAYGQLAKYDIPSGRLQADDVVNHVIVELLQRWDEIRRPDRYMYTVARRFIWQAAREGSRFTGEPLPGGDIGPMSSPQTVKAFTDTARPVDEQVVAHIISAQMREIMDTRLTEPQRQAVVFTEIAGASRKGAAAAAGRSADAISPHRHRGMKKLRDWAEHLFTGAYVVLFIAASGGLAWLTAWALSHAAGSTTGIPIADWIPPAVAMASTALTLLRAAYRWLLSRLHEGSHAFVGAALGQHVNSIRIVRGDAVGGDKHVAAPRRRRGHVHNTTDVDRT